MKVNPGRDFRFAPTEECTTPAYDWRSANTLTEVNVSVVHIHLILAHVPVIGMVVAVFLLLAAVLRRSDDLARFALAMVVVLALVAAAVVVTGNATEERIENLPGISEAAIEAHEEAGMIALWVAAALGAFALGILAVHRRRAVSRTAVGTALVLALVISGVIGWTANLGGKIRHTEIAGEAPSAIGDRDDR